MDFIFLNYKMIMIHILIQDISRKFFNFKEHSLFLKNHITMNFNANTRILYIKINILRM